MVDQISSEGRPVSPTASSKSAFRSRRKSGSKSTAIEEAIELKKPEPAQESNQGSRELDDVLVDETILPRTPLGAQTAVQNGNSPREPSRWQPRQHRLEDEDDNDDTEGSGEHSQVTLHDIIQSRWIEDPNNHASEKIYLTFEEAPLSQMSTIETSFCWVHHERDRDMHFEDFVKIIDDLPGLFTHEHTAARKCVDEAKNMRRMFANGKYFEPLVHQIKDNVEIIAGEKTEVKATFLSMPIFSSMRCRDPHPEHNLEPQHKGGLLGSLRLLFEKTHRLVHEEAYSQNDHLELATRELRKREGHPIRSLMEYTNILAVDNERDWQQAVVRLEDEGSREQPFIHVPEFWALIINMYTVVTCAPFSPKELRGQNIIHLPPEREDRRMNVKYTALTGALHEFRCRTWVGLLNTIATIEHQIAQDDELSVQLQREDSLFKIVDSKFRLLDRRRWLALTSSESNFKVYVRLFKLVQGDPLSVAYSTRKFWTSRGLAWDLMRFQVQSENLRNTLKDLRREAKISVFKIRNTEDGLRHLREQIILAKRNRIRQRFLYGAVRYHLIDPGGLLFDDDHVYRDAVCNRRMSARAESSLSTATDDARKPLWTTDSTSKLGLPTAPRSRAPSPGASRGIDSAANSQASPVGASVTDEATAADRSSRENQEASIPVGQGSSKLRSRVSFHPAVRKASGKDVVTEASMKVDSRFGMSPTDLVKKTVAPDEKILKRFQLPPPCRPIDLTAGAMSPSRRRSSIDTGSASNIRFRAPRKVSTANDLLLMAPSGDERRLPNRSLTLPGTVLDVEAQKESRGKSNRVRFIRKGHRTSTAVSRESSNVPVVDVRSLRSASNPALPRQQTPHIFKPRAPIRRSMTSRPIAIAPQRLPPLIGETEFLPRHVIQSTVSVERQAGLGLQPVPESGPSGEDRIKMASINPQQPEAQATVASRRDRKDLKGLQPFFEWTITNLTAPGTPTPRESRQSVPYLTQDHSQLPNGQPPLDSDVSAADAARRTIRILFKEMSSEFYVRDDFQIQPSHFANVEPSSFEDVAFILDGGLGGIRLSEQNRNEDSRIRHLKGEIVLSVDAILKCFIGHNNHDEPLIRKIWGTVMTIAKLSTKNLKDINANFNHCNHNVLAWIKKEVAQIEQTCQEILGSARSDTGNQDEQLDLPLPRAFPSQFRDIVLFFLSIQLLLEEPLHDQRAAEEIRDIINYGWAECESALLRDARDFKEKGDDREYMQESIKTADTLLGLLLQNAFSLCCSETNKDEKDSPRCDLEHIYRRWTTVCHERAVREASAEMYEEVRFLREELLAITTVLEDQKSVFDKILEVRESPKQTLDMRINKRTGTFLDDMIKHFRTLKDYAEEAETRTTNSIRVSNEDNSKAIFVFTVVTLIFLPLNFISSVLGMNTSDIRETSRSSKLFWEISVPFMSVVLVVCFILVKIRFKFKLRRRVGRFILMLFPEKWETEHMKIKKLGKQMPRRT